MRKIFLLFILLCLSYILQAQSDVHRLQGDWTGQGFQPGNKSVWEIEVNYVNGKEYATVKYPGLNCGGRWDIVSETDKQIVFEEKITYNKKQCVDGSKIVVSYLDENRIQVVWFSEMIAGTDAYSVLHRALSFLNGKWTGLGFQPGDKQYWQADFYADVERSLFSISYPSLKCGGKWLLKSYDGHSAVFEEMIESGTENCISGSTVTLTRIDAEHLSVVWDSDLLPGTDSFVVLERSK